MAFLIDDLILFPFHLVMSIGEKIAEAVEQRSESSTVMEDLLRLQALFELGGMSREEFEREEARLLEQLSTQKGAP